MWPAFFAGHHGAVWALWPAWNGRPLDALFAANGQSVMLDTRATLGKVRAGPWAMEAARLETGSAGGVVALFATTMTVLEGTGRNIIASSLTVVILVPVST